MKAHTSEWIRSLPPKDRKRLVGILYELRPEVLEHVYGHLFIELMRVVDNEYHALKNSPEGS